MCVLISRVIFDSSNARHSIMQLTGLFEININDLQYCFSALLQITGFSVEAENGGIFRTLCHGKLLKEIVLNWVVL